MMVVSHNLMAMNANRQFNIVTKNKAKSNEKLSSGYRINRAADDAAGLSISEKMRNQIRGLNQAMKNIDDGISLIQVGDGALGETHSILHRMYELAIQASNDVNSAEDRKAIDDEIQQLKGEMKRIFSDTEFNGKNLFRTTYVPEVTGEPDDIQIFNAGLDNAGNVVYGGISVNNIRYTWDDIGIALEADGKTFAMDNEYHFTSWDGEDIVIETKAGSEVPTVSRYYFWEADTDGINVNGKQAATWSQMGIDVKAVQSGEYSFDYHGMNISFEVEEGDTEIKDVIDQINGDDFGRVSWQTTYAGTDSEKAVNILDDMNLNITQANKDVIIDQSQPYDIQADETGITLTDTQSGTHTQISWEDFKDNTKVVSPDTTNGGFPIVDWGLDNQTNGQNYITFDAEAIYEYKDDVTGISFQFQLADEASRDAVLAGLNVDMSAYITAPTKAEVASAGSASGDYYIQAMSSNISFDTQRDCNRDFDDAASVIGNGTVSVSHDGAGNYLLEYTLNNGEVLSGTFEETQLRNMLTASTNRNMIIRLENGKDSISLGFSADQFEPSDPNLSEDAKRAEFEQYVANAIDYIDGTNVVTQADGYAVQHLSFDENTGNNVSLHTNWGVVVNAPERSMIIQSGANQGDVTEIRWSPLSLGIIGMANTNTRDFSSSQAAIGEIDYATKYISYNRSKFGAYQNRLERTYNHNADYSENLTWAESQIRDTDMADEMVSYSKNNILQQVGQAMIAQANQQHDGVLNLLQ